jgi:phage baseplate assembly protein V
MLEQINRMMQPLANRISSLMTLGKLTRIDPGANQQCQVEMLEDELRDQLPHNMPYGFSHVPQPGADAYTVFLRGDKSGGIVLQISDPRHTPTLQPGEVALHDDQEQIIHITRDGITIKTDKLVTIDSPEINISGNINLNGIVKINGITQVGN